MKRERHVKGREGEEMRDRKETERQARETDR